MKCPPLKVPWELALIRHMKVFGKLPTGYRGIVKYVVSSKAWWTDAVLKARRG